MKIVLMIVILIGATVFGNSFSKRMKDKLQFYKDLNLFCNIVEQDIKFLKNNLKTIVQKNENVFGSTFRKVINDFFVLKKPYENILFLNENENVFVKNFLESLGKYDVMGEVNNLKNHKIEIDRNINEKTEQFNKTGTMGTKLGFIFGLLTCVVLL